MYNVPRIKTGREGNKHHQGVGLLLSRHASDALLGYECINERFLTTKFQTSIKDLNVICCYAPTEDADEGEKDRFYEQIQDILNSVKKGDIILVLGNFNAKTGTDSDLWGGVIGPFGIGSCNGQCLLQILIAGFPLMGTSALKGNCSVIQSVDAQWTRMSCEECETKFSILKRKRTCCDCNHDFCSSCVMRVKGIEKRHRCRRCRIFSSVPLDRNAIIGLRVRDLRWFLDSNSVSMHGCKEKADLVELVMQHSGFTESSHYPQNYERHTIPVDLINCDSQGGSSESSPVRMQESPSHSPGPSGRRNSRNNAEIGELSIYAVSETTDQQNIGSEIDEQHLIENIPRCEEETFKPISVQDLESLEQIAGLSVMQLKLILTRNFVDYKGCCEKQELQEKVRWLWMQKQEARHIDSIADENLCKICMEAPIDSVLLECGHMTTCTECGKRLHECPICRQYVVRVVHTFKA